MKNSNIILILILIILSTTSILGTSCPSNTVGTFTTPTNLQEFTTTKNIDFTVSVGSGVGGRDVVVYYYDNNGTLLFSDDKGLIMGFDFSFNQTLSNGEYYVNVSMTDYCAPSVTVYSDTVHFIVNKTKNYCTLYDPNTFDGSECGVTIANSELNGYDNDIPSDVYDSNLGTGLYGNLVYNQLLFLNNDVTSVILEIENSTGQRKNTTLPLNQCIMESGFYPQYTDPYMLISILDNHNGYDFESIVSCSFINGGVHDDYTLTDPIVQDGGTSDVRIYFEYEEDITPPSIIYTSFTDDDAITRYDDNKIYIGLSCEDNNFDYQKINLYDNSNNLLYSLYTNESDVETILTKSDNKLTDVWEVTELNTLSGLTLTGIDSTPNGEKIVVSTVGYVYYSTNFGATWRKFSNLTYQSYSDVDITDNGNNIAVSVYNGYVYASTDGGLTFTEHSELGAMEWIGIAISNTGELYGSIWNYFYYHYNNIEWLIRDAVPTVDPSCKYFTTDDNFDNIYVIYDAQSIGSVNVTTGTLTDLTPISTTGAFCNIKQSRDKSLLILASESAYYYVSNDSGLSWSDENVINGNPLCNVGISDDGNDVIMTHCYGNNDTYISNDRGQTFNFIKTNPQHVFDSVYVNDTFYFISDKINQIEEERDNLSFGLYKYEGVCYDFYNHNNVTNQRTITLAHYVVPPIEEEN